MTDTVLNRHDPAFGIGTLHPKVLAMMQKGSDSKVLPVVQRIEAKFRKPAKGQVVSTIKTPVEALALLQTELTSKGRSFITTSVDLHDEAGQHTLDASFEWLVVAQQV